MIRSLATLVVLVLAPLLTLLLFDGPYNPVTVVSKRLSEAYQVSIYGSTFALIDRQIEETDPVYRSDRIAEIVHEFDSNLVLMDLADANLPSADKKRVQDGDTVYAVEDDVGTLTRLLPGTNRIMVMFVDENEIQETYRLAKGPISLIEKHIQNHPQEEWPEALEELKKTYPIPLELMPKNAFVPPEKIGESFTEGNLSWFEDGDDEDWEIFFLELEGSDQGILVGPLPTPVAAIASIYTFFLVFVVFLISLCLMVWLWPLWRNLKALQTSASALGAGHLSSRVRVKKRSIVSDLGKSFNQMADGIQKLITANQQLTNAVAHDLRTPLARLRFALEILESGECSPEETQRYKQSIQSSIDSLDYLVNQTLVHSRYNRMPDIRNFGECKFSEILREEVDQAAFDHPELEFQINIDRALESSVQFVDKNALRRALSNLVSNAIKHASLTVVVSYFEDKCLSEGEKNECLHLRVEDDGEGIDEQDYQRILQPFAQLDNDERDHSLGHGLGLAIVDQVAKWHKGETRIDRSSQGGALVELAWPRLESPS